MSPSLFSLHLSYISSRRRRLPSGQHRQNRLKKRNPSAKKTPVETRTPYESASCAASKTIDGLEANFAPAAFWDETYFDFGVVGM